METSKTRWRFRLCIVVLGLLAYSPAHGQIQEAIPEPDTIFFGAVTNLPSGPSVAKLIEGPAEVLDMSNVECDLEGRRFVLRARLVDDSNGAPLPLGTSTVGATARIVLNDVAQGNVTIDERGTIYRVDSLSFVSTAPSPLPALGQTDVVTLPTPTFTVTPLVTPTLTRPTPTATRIQTGPTGTPTGTPTPTPTVTPGTPSSCGGDCSGDGRVLIDELVVMVRVALEQDQLTRCQSGDRDGDGRVRINELIIAVNNALQGCED